MFKKRTFHSYHDGVFHNYSCLHSLYSSCVCFQRTIFDLCIGLQILIIEGLFHLVAIFDVSSYWKLHSHSHMYVSNSRGAAPTRHPSSIRHHTRRIDGQEGYILDFHRSVSHISYGKASESVLPQSNYVGNAFQPSCEFSITQVHHLSLGCDCPILLRCFWVKPWIHYAIFGPDHDMCLNNSFE